MGAWGLLPFIQRVDSPISHVVLLARRNTNGTHGARVSGSTKRAVQHTHLCVCGQTNREVFFLFVCLSLHAYIQDVERNWSAHSAEPPDSASEVSEREPRVSLEASESELSLL